MKYTIQYKISAWFFIFLMMSQSVFAYGTPGSVHEQSPHQTNDTSTDFINTSSVFNQGIIGLFEDKALDNPADNYFKIQVDEQISSNSRVYLVYQLEGITHYTGVARSINDGLATGGHWVTLSDDVSLQREPIHPSSIKQGENTVLFTLPAGADYGYRVSNVRFEIDNNKATTNPLVVTAIEHSNKLYIKGFTSDEVNEISAGNIIIPTHCGNFEAELDKKSAQNLTLTMADGTSVQQAVKAEKTGVHYFYPITPFGKSTQSLFQTQKHNVLSLEGTSLSAAEHVTKEDKAISLTTLRHNDLPALDMGMSNVTGAHRGYRFLPHGEHFTDSGAVVTIAYDKLQLPSGYTEKDINAYYFNKETGHWAALKKDSVDTRNGLIYARTTHFTDMIAGVIKAPESPETAGFTPTMMTGIKAADPTAKVGLIAPPEANSRGTAGMQYPFEMPPARNGMAPQVALSYNSDGGSSWAGQGWDIQIPAITVETRWGVPRYNPQKETETYLKDGSMIGFMDGDELHLPHRHKEKTDRAADRRFYPRKEGSFSKIIRKGSSPGTYTWEITDKSGTVYTYGGNGGILKGTITDIEGNTREVISEWKLSKIQEKHGDYIEYHYDQKTEAVRGTLTANALYLKSIKNNSGTEVLFTSNSEKTKQTNNARYGFLTSNNRLLDKIDIQFEGETLRSYTFDYSDGAFHTKLLTKVTQYDSKDEEFAAHTFDYYDDVNNGGSYMPFADAVQYDVPEDRLRGDDIMNWAKTNAVGGSKTKSWGAGSYVGFGPGCNIFTKKRTAGIDYDYNKHKTEGLMTLVDIDGDGLADRVFAKDGKLQFRRRIAGSEQLFSSQAEEVQGSVNSFSYTEGKSNTFGVMVYPTSASIGGHTTIASNKTPVYFTDANNDGLIDIVRNGKVYFNRIVDGVPHFNTSSSSTPNPVLSGEALSDELDFSTYTEEEIARLKAQNPLHDAVRVWHAPDSGNISINAPVRLIKNEASEAESPDGVRVFIQKNNTILWQQDIAWNNYQVVQPQLNQEIEVLKDDRIYFRVHSLDNGYDDRVQWNPEITYTDKSETTTDPNGKPYYQYTASEDFLLSGNYVMSPTMNGLATIEGEFKKPVTSDDLEVFIIRETSSGQEEELWHSTYEWSADTVQNIKLEDVNLSTEDKLTFNVYSSSNIKWETIDWKPVLYYTQSFDDEMEMMDEEGNPNFKNYPIPYFSLYNKRIQTGTPFADNSEREDSVLNILPFAPKLYGEKDTTTTAWITVKKQSELLAKKQLIFTNGILTNNDTIKIEKYDSEPVYIEYFTESEELTEYLGDTINVKLNGISHSVQPSVYTTIKDTKKLQQGHLYRGWGQFTYNANEENRAEKPIDESKLSIEDDSGIDEDSEANEIDNIEGDSMDDLQDDLTASGGYDASKAVFIIMQPKLEQQVWQGYDEAVFIGADSQSASRMGDKEISADNSNQQVGDGEVAAPVKKNKTTTYSGSAGILGLGASGSKAESRLVSDYMDMNGDGYPDVLAGDVIQYTGSTGGLSSETLNNGRINYSESWTAGVSAGGRPILLYPEKVQKTHKEKLLGNLTVSGQATTGTTTDSYTYIDVNGDGLPDKAYKDGKVAINTGYAFLPSTAWGFEQVQQSAVTSINPSAGAGIIGGGLSIDAETGNVTGGSLQFTYPKSLANFQAGIGFSHSRSQPDITFVDVNSDGLPDWTSRDGNTIRVRLNTGNGFDNEITLNSVDRVSESLSLDGSANIAFTYGIPLFITRIVFNPRVNLSRSVSREERQLKDIDGDGNLDFVVSHASDWVKVYSSTIARTNKLKSVANPLGGSFAIDYKRTPATYNHPGGKWVMASLEINDGIADDGANSLTEFDYADGKRDRYEREFLGFGKVTTRQLDAEQGNALYRSVEQTYDVTGYYTAGNSLGSTLKDAQGKIYTQSTQQYYTYKVSVSGDNYSFAPVGEINKLSSPMVFTPVKFSQTANKEGDSGNALLQQSHYSYRNGGAGELAAYKFSDTGSLTADGGGTFNYQTTINYDDKTAKRILGLPDKVRVTGGDGTLYRETAAKYDALGRITEVAQTLEAGKATSNFEWDKFGNITKHTLPANSTGQRMWYSYRYERDYNMYPTRIDDAWGYRSELEDYDYRYGVALRTKDINGYYQEQQIDHMGRITQITAPNELAEGAPYTIRFTYPGSYAASRLPHVALTAHYDPEHPDNPMNTATFVDGLGRAIQVKKDGVVANGNTKEEVSIVSGRAWFDAFGRATKAWYPTTAPLNEHAQFSDAFDDVSPTLTTFDVMDRAVKITLPDGTETTHKYQLEGNLQKVQTTDANGGKQVSYTNGSGLNVKTEQLSGPDGTITTQFKYDAINQLLQAIDTEGNAIVSAYDMGGRRTAVTHPDAGTTRFTYDNLGNVLTRQTANLADSNAVITYAYDYHRLTEINYPFNPENNVRYHYGNAHATHNRKGRLVLQEDATGAQEFFYGRMGEVTKVRRTHIIPNHAVATFETQWTYDSWNRVREMIYPDKEKLTYHYNAGGQLQGLTGNKAYSYNYVQDVGYDKFGQRSYIKYCNGTETNYTYNAQNRRLQNLQAKNQSTVFMDNAYTFDDVGNILGVVNSAAAGELMGGEMNHAYQYDGLYRLATAEGTYTGADSKTAAYSLEMAYDNLHNITAKKQHIEQTDIAFEGDLMAGYELSYNYSSNKPHQLANIEDVNYRTADSTAVVASTKNLSDAYHYDNNGNLVYVNTSDSVQTQMKERKLSWDEENRLRAICDNGYVSSYFYDATGERTVKLHGSGEGIHVNGVFSGGYTNNANYTLYVNAYMVLEKGGQYTKHIYIGDQRIVSKLGDVGSFGVDPRREQYAGEDVAGVAVPDYASKYGALQGVIKDNYELFEVDYYAVDNDDYVNGEGFCCDNSSPQLKSIPVDNVDYEKLQYYYHSDHLGSASYITNLDGEVVQHVEYVPFGEVFIEERNNTWNTPYLFNGKELDEETGLYYYGARYYNPRISVFYGCDPLMEEYFWQSPYAYAANNPVRFIDWMGMGPGDKVYSRGQVNSFLRYAHNNINKKTTHSSYGYRINDRHDCITSVTYGVRYLNRDMSIKAGTPMSKQMSILQDSGYAGDRFSFDFLDERGNLTEGVTYPVKLSSSISEKMMNLSDQEDGTYAFGLSLADDYHSATILLNKDKDDISFTFIDQNQIGENLSGEKLDEVFTNYVKKVRKTVDTKTTISIWQYINKNVEKPLEKLEPKGIEEL